jgi:asparagine N-glycosylation enzyme membrane subunit Stt3
MCFMKSKIIEIIDNLLNSFKSNKSGWSARKLTSFVIVVFGVIYGHIKYIEKQNFIEVLSIDYLMILLLLGLVTFSQINELRNGKKEDKE